MGNRAITVLVLAGTAVFSGCDPLDQARNFVIAKLGDQPSAAPSPGASGGPQPSGSPAASPSPSDPHFAKVNSELLQEVFRVVLIREPKSPSEFGGWVDVLNQGASFEGVYNGFTHSSVYRQMEIDKKSATPLALKTFSEELAVLELELAAPSHFTEDSAKPLPVLGQIGEDPAPSVPREVEYGKNPQEGMPVGMQPSPTKPSFSELRDQYAKLFLTSSVFTLKRVLADEALKVIASKRSESTERLAEWYGRWVFHMATRGVDFGLALRNKADEKFHTDWALKNLSRGAKGEDLLRWEVLNRVHRVLNQANSAQ